VALLLSALVGSQGFNQGLVCEPVPDPLLVLTLATNIG